MKIRCGFVSNSSSSSFVLDFGKKPDNKDIEKLLNWFGEFDNLQNSVEHFKKDMVELTDEYLDNKIEYYSKQVKSRSESDGWKDYCRNKINKIKQWKKLAHELNYPIYYICISDDSGREPWYFYNIKSRKIDKDGKIVFVDGESLEANMFLFAECGNIKAVIDYENGH